MNKGLTLTPTRFHATDQMEQVHYRDEAVCSTASIIHPSAVSSVSQIPREPVGTWEAKQSVHSPPPTHLDEADPAVTLRLLRDFIMGTVETMEARRLRSTESYMLNDDYIVLALSEDVYSSGEHKMCTW